MNIYLDNAATTPLDPQVLEAMLPFMKTHYGNPSSIHAFGRKSRTAIEKARKIIAQHLNCSTAEIFFTSGGTESNNTILLNALQNLSVKRIITSPIEHHCILHTLDYLKQHFQCTVEFVKLNEKGAVDLENLDALCANSTEKTMVTLMHANNEIGNLLPIQQVAEICQKHQCLFHSDTVQTIGKIPFDLQKTPIHFLAGAGHKLYGPKGAGFLYINAENQCKPLLYGGGQERNMRAGTENIYGIVGLSKAVELSYQNIEENAQHIKKLKKYCLEKIQTQMPEVTVNGLQGDQSLYTILNLNFSNYPKTDMLLMNLDIEGICASGGSACSSGVDAGSHVIQALNLGSKSIRFSFSKFNQLTEIDYVLNTLNKLLLSPVT